MSRQNQMMASSIKDYERAQSSKNEAIASLEDSLDQKVFESHDLNARHELLLNRHESLLRHTGTEASKLQQANYQSNANNNRHRIELQQEKHNWERKFDELKLQHSKDMIEAKSSSCSIM